MMKIKKDVVERGIVAITGINTRVTSKGIQKNKADFNEKVASYVAFALLKLKGNFLLTKDTAHSVALFSVCLRLHLKKSGITYKVNCVVDYISRD